MRVFLPHCSVLSLLLTVIQCLAVVSQEQAVEPSASTEHLAIAAQELWNIYTAERAGSDSWLGSWCERGPSVQTVAENLTISVGMAAALSKQYFFAKPLVVFAGQFSTGKTTFIQDLILETEYPDSDVAARASTDKFTLIHDCGTRAQCAGVPTHVPGPTGVRQLSLDNFASYGDGFLQRLDLVSMSHEDAPILQLLDVLDSPGVLSARDPSKHFDLVRTWKSISNDADMVIVLFDVKSGDISDNFNQMLEHFATLGPKVHLLLNKADTHEPFELLQTFGGIMWKLSRAFKQPESSRIHFGSFHNKSCNVDVSGTDLCRQFDRTKARLRDLIFKLPKDVTSMRMGAFSAFLERLKVTLELIKHLKSLTIVEKPGLFLGPGRCQNVDNNGLDLTSELALRTHIEDIRERRGWNTVYMPDTADFCDQVLRIGVCELHEPLPEYIKAIEDAQAELDEMYTRLNMAPAMLEAPHSPGFYERWGI